METPSTGPTGATGGPADAGPPTERGDREVFLFLGGTLLPALGDRPPRAIRDAVRRAVRDRQLGALERLSGRHRQELLLALEQLGGTRRRPPPSVMVRLTTVISATPASSEGLGVSATRPAR